MLFHYCGIIIEFLSFIEFKFVKIVGRLGCNCDDDAPCGGMAALRAAGPTFLGGRV